MLLLKDVLAMELLEEARLLTGNEGLGKVVQGVSIMEAPDIVDWVEGNEIILTNLYSVHQDHETMQAFVQSLGEKDLCALMVKTGRFFSQVPDVVLGAAERHGIAVVELPAHLRFSDIIYQIMAAVLDSQVEQLRYLKQTRDLLTSLALSNAGVAGIARSFAGIVQKDVVVLDGELAEMYPAHPGQWTVDASAPVTTRRLGDFACEERTLTNGETRQPAFCMPIKAMNMTVGHLAMLSDGEDIRDMDLIAMQNAADVLSLEMLKEFAVREVERTFKIGIIDDILAGKTTAIQGRGESIDWHSERRYTPAIITFSHTAGSGGNIADRVVVGRVADMVDRTIYSLLAAHSLAGIVECRRYKAVLFVEEPEGDAQRIPARLNAFWAAVEKQLPKTMSGISSVMLGCAGTFGSLADMPKLYHNAEFALEMGEALGATVCDYEKLGMFKLLRFAEQREDLTGFLPKQLLELEAYDKANQANLTDTLESYFANSRNYNQAAAALFIHYKTMTYRMHKIQEITGLDLKNQSEMLEMEVGLQIRKLLR